MSEGERQALAIRLYDNWQVTNTSDSLEIYCYERGKKDGYNKAIDDFVKYIDECSGWTQNCIEHNIGLTVYTLHQIAEQLKEGGENVEKEYKGGWILCEDKLPESYPTIFEKLRGTEKWDPNMPLRMSDEVIATVQYEDGTRRTVVTKTVDGIWKQKFQTLKYKVIAWMPLPEPLQNE